MMKATLRWSGIGLLYLAQRLRAIAAAMRRPHKTPLGLITGEFYGKDLHGFGGYGHTAKSITDFYNLNGAPFSAEVLLAKPAADRSVYLQRHHHADVLFRFADHGTLARNVAGGIRYTRLLLRRCPTLLISLEYYGHYESWLKLYPAVPLLMWIRDPRTAHDWRKIATMSLAHVELHEEKRRAVVEQTRASLHRVLRLSKVFRRKIFFAHQAACLLPKAKELYGLAKLQSTFLPNPIPVPPKQWAKADRPLICYLGRLDPVKRPWIFCELAKRLPSTDFVVMGTTHVPEVMQPILSRYRDVPNLRFLGQTDGAEKRAILQRAWALVNTSIHEALPVSFEEAFAAATPIVSCQNPDGLTERFGRYVGERLGDGLDADSLGAFETALADLLAHPDERLVKGEAARQYVESTHSFEAFERSIDAMIRGGQHRARIVACRGAACRS